MPVSSIKIKGGSTMERYVWHRTKEKNGRVGFTITHEINEIQQTPDRQKARKTLRKKLNSVKLDADQIFILLGKIEEIIKTSEKQQFLLLMGMLVGMLNQIRILFHARFGDKGILKAKAGLIVPRTMDKK